MKKKTVEPPAAGRRVERLVSVSLSLTWEGCQAELWKIVKMPAVPVLGTVIWFDDCEMTRTIHTVAQISWWEDWPDVFEVELSPVGFIHCTAEEFVIAMKKRGWQEGAFYDAR